VLLAKAGLLNHRGVLTLLSIGIAQPFAVYFMTNYMRSLPREVIDAAALDGASKIKIYYQIILPLSRPAIATIALIDFLGFWNELLWSLLFIRDPQHRTLTVIVSVLQGDQHISIPEVCAGLILAALPVFLLYLIVQEQLIKGMAAGAVKS
jgi:raffinose/stachyose/melibiose transport system permease protein